MISRAVWLTSLLLLLWEDVAFCKTPEPPVATVRPLPGQPIIELRDSNQFLNFDLVVRNTSRFTLRIAQIDLSVYDSAHQLVLRKSINTDAFAPSIAVIGKQTPAGDQDCSATSPFGELGSVLGYFSNRHLRTSSSTHT